jgi:cyanophycinase-like exopeptidase
MTRALAIAALCATTAAHSQSYTSWFTGNTTDAEVQPQFGLCLMGGGGESDEAMQWFLERANGGDVVVLRTSGSDGYNNYLFSELGVPVNSVETIRFNNASAANDPYVIDRLAKAEAIWIAGGNQANYVNYWRNTPVQDAINHLINVKGGVVGGISAGMAIMGQAYFAALNGGMTQATALNNPFNTNMTIGWNDFIDAPFLKNVITDTHFNDPQALRYGRLTTFMARVMHDHGVRALGMGANEYCAIAIDETGLARAFGEFGTQWPDDFVYFLQPNCIEPSAPEVMQSGQPLTWVRGNEAVKVYRVPATVSGQNYFDLNTWNEGGGGTWMNWYVNNGQLTMEPAAGAPGCILFVRATKAPFAVRLYPNPASDVLTVYTDEAQWQYRIYDLTGRLVAEGKSVADRKELQVSHLAAGLYKIAVSAGDFTYSASFVRGY